MKDTLRSPWFFGYILLNLAGTIAFFYMLHHQILEQNIGKIVFISLLYAAAMYGLGSIFGSLIKTSDYHAEGKAFHIVAFVITNIVQFVWIAGFSPLNFFWFPFILLAWSYALWIHLNSNPHPVINEAEQDAAANP